jgi:hypothetical protein
MPGALSSLAARPLGEGGPDASPSSQCANHPDRPDGDRAIAGAHRRAGRALWRQPGDRPQMAPARRLPWKATAEERAIICVLRRAIGFPLDDLTFV